VYVHAIPLCVAGVLHSFAEPRTVFLFGGLTATVIYTYLIYRECRGKEIALTPLTCFLFWFALVLGPTPVYVALRFPEDQAVPFLIWLVPMQAVATGYVITLLGACCLHLGIVLGRGKQKEAGSEQQGQRGSLSVHSVVLCAAISTLYAWFGGSLLFLGSTFGYLLQDIGPAAACLYAASRKSGLKEEWTKLFVLVPVCAILAIAQGGGGAGSKIGFFNAMLPLVWFFLVDRRRRRIFFAVSPLVAGVFIFYITPTVSTARELYGSANVSAENLLEVSRTQVADSFYRDPGEYALQSMDHFVWRAFTEPIAVGYIVTRVENEGYTNGSTLAYVIWGAVPRIFWEDKPVVNRGQWFTSDVGFSMTAESATTSTGMTSPGELYWNFGWIGVMVGMGGLGFLISALLWRLASPDPRASLVTMLPYVHVLMNFMVMQDAEAGTAYLQIVLTFLLYFALAKFVQSLSLRNRMAAFGFGD
jgi:hypothetical protein